jgi:plasmid stabilization system protein ParE
MLRIVFHRLARRELNDAARYYELESRGLGGTFLDEVERGMDLILRHPDAGSPIGGDIRRRLLRRFPYGLLYTVRGDRVRILAVMNLRRRPMYWVGRE